MGIRVCLDARLRSGELGGIEQVVIGLAHGLSSLHDGDEEYIFLANQEAMVWLEPYVNGPCRIVAVPEKRSEKWEQGLMRLGPVRKVVYGYGHLVASSLVKIAVSDGTVERLGADLVHFTRQKAFTTNIPSIYHPHDLQHLHFPQYFRKLELMSREARYRTYCRQAAMVAAASSWIREDIIQHYGLSEEKVKVIPLAPPVEAYPVPSERAVAEIRARLGVPDAFIFYPAQTWEHKNHLGLLEAINHLRKRGLRIPLVCSGRRNDFFPAIRAKIRALGLDDQVQFFGFVSPIELQALYRLCRGVVIPTRYEAASFPIWEAFVARAPVACSDVVSLRNQVRDAALLFDPEQTGEMAEAIARMWGDEQLRQMLIEKARVRVSQFTWSRTARLFRAHYRRLTNYPLTEEDRTRIAAEPEI